MNVFLLILQVLLALHTGAGALWKFSKSAEQTMPALKAIPQTLWLGLSGVELLCAVALLIPLFYKPLGLLAPIAAAVIVVDMLVLCGVHLASGDPNRGPMVYWLVVAAVCAFLAYGRFVLQPA